MTILTELTLLSKTQNCMSLSSLYQQKTTKNYQNFFAKDLKDQFIGMNMKENVRIKIRKMSIDTFYNQVF